MKKSLLYIVQQVCSKLDFDPINSINDTPEAIQIADEAEVTYYDLISRNEWPHTVDQITVESVSDVTRPTELKIPDNVVRVDNIRYNIQDVSAVDNPDQIVYRTLEYMKPEVFLDYVLQRNTTIDEVEVVMHGDVQLFVVNNEFPSFWTSFDNEYIVCDAYRKDLTQTLIGSKASVRGVTLPEWQGIDTFVPDLPAQMFPLFLAEVTAACSIYFKQAQSPEDERRRNRGISRMRRKAYSQAGFGQKKNYGRRNLRQTTETVTHTGSTAY